MSARTRRRHTLAVAIALTAAVTSTGLLTACDPTPAAKAAAPAAPSAVNSAPAAAPSSPAAPVAPSSPSAPVAPSSPAAPTPPTSGGQVSAAPITATHPATSATPVPAPAPVVNLTAHTGLTISNGTNFVVMNGTTVNFGTTVRDLAWSPDGSRAAFINGAGNLVTSNPDGSGRVVVATAPSGQSWSHPTWQVAAADTGNQIPAKNNIIFAATKGGVSQLERVVATAANGTPTLLSLGNESDDNVVPNPMTGNVWPNGAGKAGTTVYANANGEVYVRDDYLRQQGGEFTKGSEPAMSPDETEIVFVRSVGGHDHLFETATPTAPAKDLTPNATTDYTEPAFSPDGKTIAARTPAGVVTLAANGSTAPKLLSGVAGLPAYRG